MFRFSTTQIYILAVQKSVKNRDKAPLVLVLKVSGLIVLSVSTTARM